MPETEDFTARFQNDFPRADARDLLVALSWFGPMTLSQLRLLLMPHHKEDSMRLLLKRLAKANPTHQDEHARLPVVEQTKRTHYTFGKGTYKAESLWTLTRHGAAQVAAQPDAPPSHVALEPATMDVHDILVTTYCVQIFNRARAVKLRAIGVDRNGKLMPQTRLRPACDAALTIGHGHPGGSRVVQFRTQSQFEDGGEGLSHRYALIVLREDMPPALVADHCRKLIANIRKDTRRWTPLVVAADANQVAATLYAWEQHWQSGHLLLTTRAGFALDQWTYWARLKTITTTRTLFSAEGKRAVEPTTLGPLPAANEIVAAVAKPPTPAPAPVAPPEPRQPPPVAPVAPKAPQPAPAPAAPQQAVQTVAPTPMLPPLPDGSPRPPARLMDPQPAPILRRQPTSDEFREMGFEYDKDLAQWVHPRDRDMMRRTSGLKTLRQLEDDDRRAKDARLLRMERLGWAMIKIGVGAGIILLIVLGLWLLLV